MDFSLFEPRQDAVLVFPAGRASAPSVVGLLVILLGLKLQDGQLLFAVGRNLGSPYQNRGQSQAGGFSAARWPAASAAATIAAASGVIFLGSVNVEEPPPAAESPPPPAFPPAAANRRMLSQAQGRSSGEFLGQCRT